MRKLVAVCGIALALPGLALAQNEGPTPGRELSELIYGSIESNPSGSVDLGQFVEFGDTIFVSMNTDQNVSVDIDEFFQWDFGFNFIAADDGEQRSYEAAQRIVFAMWDHDADGQIERSEYHKSMLWDFRRADLNDDAFLTRDEFLQGYIVIRAYRAAISGR